jgi:hypothetical protein
VDFSITRHSGWSSPENAIDLLWERLGARREEASFARERTEIRAIWRVDLPVAMERNEREELGRAAILEIVRGVCEKAPELKSDWFAVSALG